MLFKCLKWPSSKLEKPQIDVSIDEVVSWVLLNSRSYFPQTFSVESQNKWQREHKFQCIAVFMVLAIGKLKGYGEFSQLFHDKMFDLFDIAMREQGVADVRIGAEVRKLSSAFQGRFDSYMQALEAGDEQALAEAFLRNGVFYSAEDAQVVTEMQNQEPCANKQQQAAALSAEIMAIWNAGEGVSLSSFFKQVSAAA